jgi:hypothetical protein
LSFGQKVSFASKYPIQNHVEDAVRIIKLSTDDADMKTRDGVDRYFLDTLPKTAPPGQFLVTKGRISENGVSPGERLVFSYKGELVYIARAASERLDTAGPEAAEYPHYFIVDVESIQPATGRLTELEADLHGSGLADQNIARTRGWPIIDESGNRSRQLEQRLGGYTA